MRQAARTSSNLKPRLLAGAFWILSAAAAGPAFAEPPSSIDIPAGPLDAALSTLAGQTHQQVLYRAELVAHRRSPAVKGVLTSEEALARLLEGAGIAVKRTRPNVLVLQDAASAAREASGPATARPFAVEGAADPVGIPAPVERAPALLEEVTVTGSNLRGVAPASPLVLMTRADLERTGHANLADALRTLPSNFSGAAGEGNQISGGDRVSRNGTYASALNLRGLGNNATLVLLNGRRMAGSGPFSEFVDISTIPAAAVERVEVLLDGASALYGPNNTILDNCHVYTAFAALDPLTQEKVSRLTGTVAELRTTRSGPAGLAAGRASVSRGEAERPLLEPGEIRALPDDEQLVFAAGQRALRCRKVRYDDREPFRRRAAVPAPPPERLDTPARPTHPWAGRRALGEDRAVSLPLFKEVAAAMDDRKAAQRAAEIYDRVAQEMAAQEAALDQLQGGRHG